MNSENEYINGLLTIILRAKTEFRSEFDDDLEGTIYSDVGSRSIILLVRSLDKDAKATWPDKEMVLDFMDVEWFENLVIMHAKTPIGAGLFISAIGVPHEHIKHVLQAFMRNAKKLGEAIFRQPPGPSVVNPN